MDMLKSKLTVISIIVLVLLFIYKFSYESDPITVLPKNEVKNHMEKQTDSDSRDQPQKILQGSLNQASTKQGNKELLPLLDASTVNPSAYFKWVINNGGKIVLTRGGNNKVVGLLDQNLRAVPHGTYEIPVGITRVVTSEAAKIWNGSIPNDATRVLMYWPKVKQLELEEKLLSMPFSGHAQRLKATYTVKGDLLLVNIKQVKASGAWYPTNELISL